MFVFSGPMEENVNNCHKTVMKVFRSANRDPANILGMTDFHFENSIFGYVVWFQISRHRRNRQRRTNSQIPTWPLSQRTQGSNTPQGALAAICSLSLDWFNALKGSFSKFEWLRSYYFIYRGRIFFPRSWHNQRCEITCRVRLYWEWYIWKVLILSNHPWNNG